MGITANLGADEDLESALSALGVDDDDTPGLPQTPVQAQTPVQPQTSVQSPTRNTPWVSRQSGRGFSPRRPTGGPVTPPPTQPSYSNLPRPTFFSNLQQGIGSLGSDIPPVHGIGMGPHPDDTFRDAVLERAGRAVPALPRVRSRVQPQEPTTPGQFDDCEEFMLHMVNDLEARDEAIVRRTAEDRKERNRLRRELCDSLNIIRGVGSPDALRQLDEFDDTSRILGLKAPKRSRAGRASSRGGRGRG